jgi:hypothetical protein
MSAHSDERERGNAAWLRHYEQADHRRRQSRVKRWRGWPPSRVSRRRRFAVTTIAILVATVCAFLLVFAS